MSENNKTQLGIIQVLTKLVDLLISPKTTLPWMLTVISGPMWVISILVPIREAGALLPQWHLKQHVLQDDPRRDTYWRSGLVIQCVAILSLAPCFYFLKGVWLAIGMISLIAILSFGRALTSLTSKDIQGQLIAKGERGKFTGLLSTIAGLFSLLSALILIFPSDTYDVATVYGLIAVSCGLLLVAILASSNIQVALSVPPKNPKQLSITNLLSTEKKLRLLVIQRALLLQSALMAPYFTVFLLDNSEIEIGWLLMVSALSSLFSSYIWGIFADKDNIFVSRIATLLCILSGAGIMLLEFNVWRVLGLFLLLQVAHSGIRIHRKSYILDITNENNRTAYVAIANTLTGLALLGFGIVYTILYQWLGLSILWIMMGLLGMAIYQSQWLPKGN